MNRRMTVLAGAAAAVGSMLIFVGPAQAGTCGDVVNANVPGGQASWSHTCYSDGTMRISGWVKDTRSDGKCAAVKAEYQSGTQQSGRACPEGNRKDFSFYGAGQNVPVYLFTS
ncbi:hypothetical protein ACIA8G_42625 [Lentzea sp. NPDC051213]|uniref:hypothetical protein n=1 Tax=Lentzea sp. NPDC051213 TaxID=3364126 RepID=UPI003792994E